MTARAYFWGWQRLTNPWRHNDYKNGNLVVTNDDDCDVINDDGQAKKPGPVLLLKVQRGWRTIFQASTALKTIVNHDIFGTKLLWTILYMAKTIVNHYIFGTKLLWTILYCVSCEKTIVHHDIFGTKLLWTILYVAPNYCATLYIWYQSIVHHHVFLASNYCEP